jgi:hypothetical protein
MSAHTGRTSNWPHMNGASLMLLEEDTGWASTCVPGLPDGFDSFTGYPRTENKVPAENSFRLL